MSTYRIKSVEDILFAEIDDELYFHPAYLLNKMFKSPSARLEACKAFQTRIKPAYRLLDPQNPNSSKLYRLDDLPQVMYDQNTNNVTDHFLPTRYPMLQAQVRKAFDHKSQPQDERMLLSLARWRFLRNEMKLNQNVEQACNSVAS